MFHINPLITTHIKRHYFFHYLNLFIPIFLLPPLFKNKSNRLIIYFILILSAFILSLLLFAQHSWLTPILATLNHLYYFTNHLETEPVAVLFVFCCYLLLFFTYEYRHNKPLLIIGTLSFLWFSFIIFFHQMERAGIVLWVCACAYFIFTHFKLRTSIILSCFVCIGSILFITFSHSYLHAKMIKAYQASTAYLHSNIKQKPKTSVGLRLYYYSASLHAFKKHPFIGYGSATFSGGLGTENIVPFKHKPLELDIFTTPENNYINILLQLGLIGLCLFFAYLWYLLKLINQLPQPNKFLPIGILLITCIAAIDFPAFTYNIVGTSFAGLIAVSLGSLYKKE